MKVDLAIVGQGAVTPAGIGVAALRGIEPTPTPIAELRHPNQMWPVLRVDLKDPALTRWQSSQPRLRRASPISLFLIEAAEQALTGVSAADRAQTGLLIAFSAGCLLYSHRFFDGILTNGQKMASPALFPETVFNSPGSHVAAALNLNSAIYALCGDQTAWVSALKTAAIWLARGRVKQVLVLGAEEFDPLVLDAYSSSRWLRRKASPNAFIPSEGAAGLLVRRAEPGDRNVIATARDGFIYRTKTEAARAAKNLFGDINSAMPIYRTAQRTWLDPLEEKMFLSRAASSVSALPYLGEAFTASAAWNTIRAATWAADQNFPALLLPIWGLNHQLGLLELRTMG